MYHSRNKFWSCCKRKSQYFICLPTRILALTEMEMIGANHVNFVNETQGIFFIFWGASSLPILLCIYILKWMKWVFISNPVIYSVLYSWRLSLSGSSWNGIWAFVFALDTMFICFLFVCHWFLWEFVNSCGLFLPEWIYACMHKFCMQLQRIHMHRF